MLSNKSTILSIALLGIAQAQLQAPCNPYTSYSGCGSGFKCSPIYGNTMQNGQCVPDTQPAICYSNKGGMCVSLSQRPGSYSDGRCYSNKSDSKRPRCSHVTPGWTVLVLSLIHI